MSKNCLSPDSGLDMLSPDSGFLLELMQFPCPSYDVSVENIDENQSSFDSFGAGEKSSLENDSCLFCNCQGYLVNEWKETNTFFICDFEEKVKGGMWKENRIMDKKNILFLCREAADEQDTFTKTDLMKIKKPSFTDNNFDGNNNNKNEVSDYGSHFIDTCRKDSLEIDVSSLDTSLPEIDWDAIEEHLEATREEERKRLTDRDEIRRRLAFSSEPDDAETGKKPSLQSRLQNGMNLQICFVNDTAIESDSDSSEDTFGCHDSLPDHSSGWNEEFHFSAITTPISLPNVKSERPPLPSMYDDLEFFQKQARLQHNAQAALSKVKEMSRLQVEIDRQRRRYSSVVEMLKGNLEKAGIFIPGDRRRFHRQILTEMNISQLQVIVNELHTKIETLNESLVRMLMERDELHMEQDAMLVDIEDLTKYLYAKQTRHQEKLDFGNGPKSLQQSSFSRFSDTTRSLRSIVTK
ncbi:schwannomin-interacting protein 1-like isoform X2 [Artemia franciscana]|uniref:Schwannomin interacting protein 1 C-terminal domain-containing protein n=1 Tax=Artemia franciscana TaxID=6661 RepID=A0AA88HXH1_ARTSF|nr:hypothetical protein QYM36_005424 [Artemia franciscana]